MSRMIRVQKKFRSASTECPFLSKVPQLTHGSVKRVPSSWNEKKQLPPVLGLTYAIMIVISSVEIGSSRSEPDSRFKVASRHPKYWDCNLRSAGATNHVVAVR